MVWTAISASMLHAVVVLLTIASMVVGGLARKIEYKAPTQVVSVASLGEEVVYGDGLGHLWEAANPGASPSLAFSTTLCPNRSFVGVPRQKVVPAPDPWLAVTSDSVAAWFDPLQQSLTLKRSEALQPASVCLPEPFPAQATLYANHYIASNQWQAAGAVGVVGEWGLVTGSVGRVAYPNATFATGRSFPATGGPPTPIQQWSSSTGAVQLANTKDPALSTSMHLDCEGYSEGTCLPG